MITIREKYSCNGCHACASVCPKQCIVMQEDSEGFKYPKVNTALCVNCGKCEKVCPVPKGISAKNTPKAYAAINTDDKIREISSSGGIFYLLAEYVISQKGVVFGAKFDEEFNVKHSYAQTMEEIYGFMGSKYTQSTIGDSYLRVKQFLTEGKLVLFTGTPCQIGGLKSFLNKEYDNLICQDLICHGVPSPKVWQKYISFQQNDKNQKIQKVSFRNKNSSWKTYSLYLEFSNGNTFTEKFSANLYMQSFLRDVCLRTSCYNCSFKSKSRDADLTLADFWGIQHIMPDMDDDKGTSLVLLHTQKGMDVFENMHQHLKFAEVDLDSAIKYNPSMIKSANKNPVREKFLSEIQKNLLTK